MVKITGSLIEAYVFCPKQAWLMSRNISGDQYNEFLMIGKLLSEEVYKREKKEIITKNGKIDLVINKNGNITLIEIKKSDKYLEEAKMQLLFYMLGLEKNNYKIQGEIRIPSSRKIIKLEINKENREKLNNIIKDIKKIIAEKTPPLFNKTKKCKNCSYFEFCWS